MRRHLLIAVRAFVVLTVVTGVVYPLAVTAIARVAFHARADGSIVAVDGAVVGSSLLGQPFDGPGWFHPRPGAYDGAASGPTNLGPTNPELARDVRARILALRGQGAEGTVPADAVTTSGSGLDPDISVAYARLQAPRVAAERDLAVEEVLGLIDRETTGRTFGVLGEPRVNVLALNLAVQGLASNR
jgi:potassium-transporting ATPase KdpC subunit